MKKSLYNIEAEYLEITNQLEDGELTPELETALAINESQLQGKAVAYAYIIKEADDTITAIDAEIKRLQGLKKTEQNKSTRLKQNIHIAMDLYGINEIKTETLKINFRKSEGVICTMDEVKLDDEFVTVVPETSKPNLTAIKKAIKEGETVEGFEIETRYNLQIK
jgi:hypothetical protein